MTADVTPRLVDEGDGLRSRRAGPVLVVVLDVPHTRNAISRALAGRFHAILDRAAEDGAVGAVVIGGGASVFSAGGDFADMRVRPLAGWREHFEHMARLTRRLATYPKATVAAVEGWAIGGGMALACCCDKIVAGREARFAYGFDRMAVLPDVGLTKMLAARVGAARARRLMILAESFDAPQALAEGVVDRVVASGNAVEEAISEALVAARTSPLPAAYLKSFGSIGLESALALERDCASPLFVTADHAEGLAAFRQRRHPRFSGH